MVKLDKIKPGDILYDYQRCKMGNTKMTEIREFQVAVMDVDTKKGTMLASWNGNTPHVFYERSIKKLRVKPRKRA